LEEELNNLKNIYMVSI